MKSLPEVLQALGILFGWGLVTWGLASFFSTWEIYPFSVGLFLLSLVGWKHLRLVFSEGLYTLSRDPEA